MGRRRKITLGAAAIAVLGDLGLGDYFLNKEIALLLKQQKL